MPCAESKSSQQSVGVCYAEVIILKEAQNAEVGLHGQAEDELLRAVTGLVSGQPRKVRAIHRKPGKSDQTQPTEIIDESAGEQQHQPVRICPAIEQIAHRDQHQGQKIEGQEEVQKQNNWKKIKDEDVAGEDHGAF